jgi:hypothetical protein
MGTQRAAPSELNFSPNQVPLAIPSEATRQEFLPSNNGTFKYGNSQTIDISINGDFLLDCSQSYLHATIKNKAVGPLCLDFGPSWIQKLEIKSAGVVLESISNYGRLYAMLMAAQTDDVHTTQGVYMNNQTSYQCTADRTGNAQDAATVGWSGRVNAGPSYPAPSDFLVTNAAPDANAPNTVECAPDTGVLLGTKTYTKESYTKGSTDDSYTMCIPLVSALFNSAQMLPLLLSSAGIQLSIELAPPRSVGVTYLDGAWNANGVAAGGALYAETDYEVSGVKYVGHCVHLDSSFTNALRAQLAQSGAISMHGTCWRTYAATFQGSELQPTINIPARMRSIKSIFVTQRDQSNGVAGPDQANGTKATPYASTNGTFVCSPMLQCGLTQAQFKIGSAQFPATAIRLDDKGYASYPGDPMQHNGNGCAEAFCETLKAFGKLGATDHSTSLTRLTFSQTGNAGTPGPGDWARSFILGIDCESFGKSVIESGIDSSSRSLPIILEMHRTVSVGNKIGDGVIGAVNTYNKTDAVLRRGAVANCFVQNQPAKFITVDTFVCSDGWFFWNSDGSITPSV